MDRVTTRNPKLDEPLDGSLPLSQTQTSCLRDNAISPSHGEAAGEIRRTLTVPRTRAGRPRSALARLRGRPARVRDSARRIADRLMPRERTT